MFNLRATIALAFLLSPLGCASFSLNPTKWEAPSFVGTSPAPPGTPEWWKKNKKDAELVVGQGWRVPGFDGYYDDQGRPIRTKVAKVVEREKVKKASLLEDLNMSDSVAQMKEKIGFGADQVLAEKLYAEGEALFRAQEYGDAAEKFEQAAKRWPNSKVQQDSYFYMAECQFFDKQYPEAVDSYTLLLEKHPNSRHLDKVVHRQFEIARYWEQYHKYDPDWPTTPNVTDETRPLFDTLGRAMKTYDNIRLNDPTGPLADDAIMATANSYFLRERYADADYHYGLLREEYPRSEHQFEAHILGLQCKLRLYQGEDYVDAPLVEAKKLVKRLKVQFAGELSDEERQRLAEIQGKLNQKLAERQLRMAEYYDDLEHYGSAKFYYGQIVREFPDTPIAEEARARFVELGGKPDHPRQKLEWLVDIFPESSERQSIKQVPMLEQADTTRIASEPQNIPADDSSVYR